MTTRSLFWCDCQTNEVKIATHGLFDEELSDLPLGQSPPSVNHLLWSNDQQSLKEVQSDISVDELWFCVHPSSTIFVGTMPKPCDFDNCGIDLRDDLLSKQSCMTAFAPASSSARLLKNLKATTKELQGAHVTHINDIPVCTTAQVSDTTATAKKQRGEIGIKFAHKPKLTVNELRRAFDE